MSFKSKLGVGVMTGVLGLSLIGGGTYAAFNDVEEVSNTFAAGTLDLAVDKDASFKFDIRNLKPGDSITKQLVLKNDGTLDINQIMAQVSAEGLKDDGEFDDKDILDLNSEVFEGAGDNTLDEFLRQFNFSIEGPGLDEITTLEQVVNHSYANPFEVTNTTEEEVGLVSGEDLKYEIEIEFDNKDLTFEDSRYQIQNKFQGEGAALKFDFEATQMGGEDRSNDEVDPQ